MELQEKWICPACGKVIKVDLKFCTYCGVNLSEFKEIETTSRTPPQLQTTDYLGSSLKEGWEVPPDRIDKYHKMMAKYPIGSPIITSNCVLDTTNGFLIVSNNGFAFRFKSSFGPSNYGSLRIVWMRWHDVFDIYSKKKKVNINIKIRKKGSLKLDRKGNYKLRNLVLFIRKSKHEQKLQWEQRLESFYNIMLEIFNRNRVETDPLTSDSYYTSHA